LARGLDRLSVQKSRGGRVSGRRILNSHLHNAAHM
jgi:hypothetical protein